MKKSAQIGELRGLTTDDLGRRLGTLEKELFQLRLKHSTNQLENVSQIRGKRREIARVQTDRKSVV